MKRSLMVLVLALQCSFMPTHAEAQGNPAAMYWQPSDPGWAVILSDVASDSSKFVAMLLVYGDDGKATFYTALLEWKESCCFGVYEGDLYESRGSAFYLPYTPATYRKVGQFGFSSLQMAGQEIQYWINYDIDGRVVHQAKVIPAVY